MTSDFQAYDAYIEQHFDQFVEELRAFCAQPALAGQKIGLAESGALVREKIEALGGHVDLVPIADGSPVILGDLGSGVRTLLLYNHYDVQPPEPLELWDSPPYAGAIRDGQFYARGVADDKGDLLARVQAIRAYQATVGPLPLRLRWLIEGEEEIGSPHLGPVVHAHAGALQADFCAWEGGGRDERDQPTVVCGMKGMLYVELHARGPSHDVHSGNGGIVPNPAWRLVQALATIRDAQDNLTLDGLAELVVPPSAADRAAADAMPFDEAGLARLYGLDHWQRGLQGRAVLYTRMFEPTANIAGFTSGYGGPGAKTIVPSQAVVKMDFRLVPNQTPATMLALLRAHLDRRGFADVEVVQLGGLEVGKTPVDSPFVQAAAAVWQDLVPGGALIQPMTGGSGPFSLIAGDLGIPTAMVCGPGFAGSQIHSPNESIRLADYRTSLRYWGRLFDRLAAL
ncbi:MAG TPA: M20/M25/M40 family metallo-hydrolase [Chloroflexia bacterium]|nr:M20/M25/M40 family metallo-hydrolase [Chloroflexia bacterium]